MGAYLGVSYNSASLWGRRGAARRHDDRAFAKKLDDIDASVASGSPGKQELIIENV